MTAHGASRLLVGVALLLLFPAATWAQSDEEAVRQTLADQVEAYQSGDADAVVAFCDPECMAMPPGAEPWHGPAGARASLEELYAEFEVESEVEIEEVEVNGDLAHVRATYHDTLTSKETGEANHVMGNWLVVLRRQDDGGWKFFRDLWVPEQQQ